MGTIVVGVDGSPASREAVRFAAEEARVRGARLRAVHAWLIPLSLSVPEPAVAGIPVIPEPTIESVRGAVVAEAEQLLEEALAGIEGVEVERVLVEGAAARALCEAAAGADMLVVGSRGRGGFKGLLLGSVSRQCAHHAPCPVAIVPEKTA